MKRLTIIRMVMAAIAMTTTAASYAAIPEGYYSTLKGKKGAELKTAVHNVIKNAKVLSYGSGEGSTWWGFYVTDNDNGYVIDRYSNEKRKFGNRGSVVSGMNIEHSFPKSWWGGSSNQAYKDLYNLMPSDAKANSSKSNYGMGKVVNASYDNGCIKVGTGEQGFKVWQPSEEYEGDFARGYMYMATAYQNLTFEKEGLKSLENGDYPTLKAWASKQYIEWAKADPVNQQEIDRNEAVCSIQGNRNPFIDFPNLMEYIWGDSVDYAFDPSTTMTSSHYVNGGGSGGGDTPDPIETIAYTAKYTSADGGMTEADALLPSGFSQIWTRDSKWGWKGTAYKSKTCYAADATLWTPEIDLTNYASAVMDISHAVNFISNGTVSDALHIVIDDGQGLTTLNNVIWPEGSSWDFLDVTDIDLSLFCGKKISIGLRYTSNTSVACTWEIKSLTVRGKTGTAGISNINISDSMPTEYFTIDGKRTNADAKGIIIIKQGNITKKVVR